MSFAVALIVKVGSTFGRIGGVGRSDTDGTVKQLAYLLSKVTKHSEFRVSGKDG